MVILHFKIPIAQFSSSGFFWPPFDLPINLLFVRSPFFFSVVALCSCIVVFTLVLAVFLRNRERVRRYVTGENRRVGSVYYVRPGIAPTQPTEI